MKEKIKKLFRGTREDQMIACNLLVRNYNVDDFLDKWVEEDKTIYHFENNQGRSGVSFVHDDDREYTENDFYYHYAPHRWILCNQYEVVVCNQRYSRHVEVIEHK